MNFKLDEQTKKDLEIFPASGSKSLYDLFNLCKTYGGKNFLTKIMSEPSSDIQLLNDRKETIAFFQSEMEFVSSLDIDKNSLDFIEHYLNHLDYPTRKPTKYRALEKAMANRIKPNNDYYIIERGIDYTIEMLNNLYGFFSGVKEMNGVPPYIIKTAENVINILQQPEYKNTLQIKKQKKLKALEIADYDYIFRYTQREQIRYFMDLIYYIDVLASVARTAEKYNLCYPELLPSTEYTIEAEGLFHPFIKHPVTNNAGLDKESNMVFVSGPNMAGKSTFLRAIGVAAFLAHIGFPVPAQKMRICMLSGIYTTINLTDSLSSDYSHFYSEVRRIKEIAQKLEKNSNMLIIFDELFRGTNVKDAYEGSLAIISAFARTKNSFYIISTHILEIANILNEKNIQFVYLETHNKEGIPEYTYKVKRGISEDRLGMYIIRKEKIIEIINKTFENNETI